MGCGVAAVQGGVLADEGVGPDVLSSELQSIEIEATALADSEPVGEANRARAPADEGRGCPAAVFLNLEEGRE